tara:strand:- start:1654 stop:1779 length:126 start_codon:yes stop_codon:yes gene_type:complete
MVFHICSRLAVVKIKQVDQTSRINDIIRRIKDTTELPLDME